MRLISCALVIDTRGRDVTHHTLLLTMHPEPTQWESTMAKGQQKKPQAKKPKQDKSQASAPKSAYAQSMAEKGSPAPFVKKK